MKAATQTTIGLLAAIATITACTADDTPTIYPQPENAEHHATLHLNARVTPFDINSTLNTRADGEEWAWQDGDVVYIQYYHPTTGMRQYGHAVYSKSSDTWQASHSGTLDRKGTCEVYFFDGAETSNETVAALGITSCVYADKSATYETPQNADEIRISATLQPQTARLRLKGPEGLGATVSGLKYYTRYDATVNKLTTSTESFNTTVAASGYTPFLYCTFADETERQLTLKNSIDACSFSCSFGATVLRQGTTGYITIPTEDTNKGWEVTQTRTLQGHDW